MGMDFTGIKNRWVYDIDCPDMADVGRVLVLEHTADEAEVLTDKGRFLQITADQVGSLDLARLNSQEKALWGALVQLGGDYRSSVRREQEEKRFRNSLQKAVETILNGLSG